MLLCQTFLFFFEIVQSVNIMITGQNSKNLQIIKFLNYSEEYDEQNICFLKEI